MIRNRVSQALYRRIMRAHNDKKTFRVIVVIPLLPGFQVLINFFFQKEKVLLLHEFWTHFFIIQGGLDDAGAASVRAIMHWQYRTICRGQNSILHNLNDLLGSKIHDYISFYGLRNYGRLSDGGPVATSQVFFYIYGLLLKQLWSAQ